MQTARGITPAGGFTLLQPAVEFRGDGLVDFEFRIPGQAAAGHDHVDIAQRAQIVQRIFPGDDQIGALTRRDRSGHGAKSGQLCGAASRRM